MSPVHFEIINRHVRDMLVEVAAQHVGVTLQDTTHVLRIRAEIDEFTDALKEYVALLGIAGAWPNVAGMDGPE